MDLLKFGYCDCIFVPFSGTHYSNHLFPVEKIGAKELHFFVNIATFYFSAGKIYEPI